MYHFPYNITQGTKHRVRFAAFQHLPACFSPIILVDYLAFSRSSRKISCWNFLSPTRGKLFCCQQTSNIWFGVSPEVYKLISSPTVVYQSPKVYSLIPSPKVVYQSACSLHIDTITTSGVSISPHLTPYVIDYFFLYFCMDSKPPGLLFSIFLTHFGGNTLHFRR